MAWYIGDYSFTKLCHFDIDQFVEWFSSFIYLHSADLYREKKCTRDNFKDNLSIKDFLKGRALSTTTVNSRLGSRSTAQQYGGERTFFIKGNNVFTKHSIGNFAVLLDPRMNSALYWFKKTLIVNFFLSYLYTQYWCITLFHMFVL